MDRDLWYIFHKDGYIVEVDKLLVSDIDEHIKFLNSNGAIYRIASEDEINEHLQMQAEKSAAIKLANDAAKAKAERATAMLSGAPYTIDGTDYQISFTSEDGNGTAQVKTAFDLGVEATTIHFENGTKMPITTAEFGAFAAWFVAKRNEFFI